MASYILLETEVRRTFTSRLAQLNRNRQLRKF